MGTLHTATRVDDVSQVGRVHDYDELSEEAQHALYRLVAGETVDGDELDGTVVRFTDYYRIEAAGQQASD